MKYFEIDDFKCYCCNKNKMNESFLERLDKAREFAGTPFIISSGYRCNLHNEMIGGSLTSSHIKGIAVDIVVKTSAQRYKILTGLIEAGFNRIGMVKTSFMSTAMQLRHLMLFGCIDKNGILIILCLI